MFTLTGSAFTEEYKELNGWEKKNKVNRKYAVSEGLAYNPVAQSKYLTLFISFYSPDNFFVDKDLFLKQFYCQSGLTSYHNHSLW